MTNEQWVRSLTKAQIRALASQRGFEDWKTGSIESIIIRLSGIEDIILPKEA